MEISTASWQLSKSGADFGKTGQRLRIREAYISAVHTHIHSYLCADRL